MELAFTTVFFLGSVFHFNFFPPVAPMGHRYLMDIFYICMDIYILWIFIFYRYFSIPSVNSCTALAEPLPSSSRQGANTSVFQIPWILEEVLRSPPLQGLTPIPLPPAALRWDFPAPTLFINPGSLSGSNEPKRSRGNFPWNGQETALNGQTERQPPKEPPGERKKGFSPPESRFVELDTGNNIQEGRSGRGGEIHGFGRVLAMDSPFQFPGNSKRNSV